MEITLKNTWLRGSCVGRGACGTVNVAVNSSTGDVFAVKSVNLATASNSHVEALESEIAILKSVSSPFIVKYLDDDTTMEGSPAATFRNLHMEYLPAGTAADVADTDEATVASYTWCLVSALCYLHSKGITHCDVKGKNVLLGPVPGSARLADFGSAARISPGGAVPRGSPLWMAPEVVRGEHQGPESDVWSVGCTVIEMVTGKPAWGAEAGSVYRIGYSDELPLFPAGISSACTDFLEKCLRRDYRRRWSADQLLQHPFIAMSSNKEIGDHWSPRCVLDWFNSDFHQEEEEEYGDDDEEMVDLEGGERIRGLVSAAGVNWESEGWVVVRDGGGGGEYSDLMEGGIWLGENWGYRASTGLINSNLDCDAPYDVVTSSHFNFGKNTSNSNCSVIPPCKQAVKRLYKCSNFAIVYDPLHIFWILIEFLNLFGAELRDCQNMIKSTNSIPNY